MTNLTLILPVNNEAGHISCFLDELRQVLDGLDEEIQVLVVDDGSVDDSWIQIKKSAGNWTAMNGIKLSRKFGKEQALAAGIEMASTAAVMVMDSDGQHPVRLIPEMIQRWRETDADVVEAIKVNDGGAESRRGYGAGFFYHLMKWSSGKDFRGATDFKLLGPRAKAAWSEMGERNLFFRGMTDWLGMVREQIPFTVESRKAGESSFGFLALFRLSTTAVTSFSSAPLTIITAVGALMLIISLTLGIWTAFDKLFGAKEGFTTVILLQLFIGSLILVSLGIIGEYIARIYDEVKQRPRYLISETTD